MKLTKDEAMKCLEEKAVLIFKEREIDEKSDGLFCGVDIKDQIHISAEKMPELIEILQPVVTYNPNWCEHYPDDLEVYFYLRLCDRTFKIFALYDKEVTR